MFKSLNDLKELIEDNGYEDIVVFENPDYAEAFIGISDEDRAVYDLDLMVKSLCDNDGMTEIEAIEFIEFNCLRSLPYYSNAPIVVHRLVD